MMEQNKYRILLQDLHCELPDEDVKSMKFLAQPLIKKRYLYQNIKDGLGLFEALEDCAMLSSSNLVFLSQLLETVGRLDLYAMINEEIQCDAISGEESLVCPFRKLLFNLHKEISDNDLNRMRYLYDKVPKRATVEDSLDLFDFMIHDHSLTPENLNHLKRILSEISRQDLVEEILIFEDTVVQHQCNYLSFSKQIPGVAFQTASIESSSFSSSSQDPSHYQENGMSYPDTEQQMIESLFPSASTESITQATGMSSLSYQVKVVTEDLKACNLSGTPTASVFPLQDTGMDTGMIAIGDFTGNASPPQVKRTTASMEDFEMMDAPRAAGGDPQTAAAARGDFEKIPEQLDNAAAELFDRYKMTADPRGVCFIIDVQSFSWDHLRYRAGSEVDREKLRSTFTHLKFKVEEITNPSADDINRALMGVSQRDHSAYDCLVICILSHGGPNYFYGSDGRKFDEKRLFELFSTRACPSLASKPKLFFFSYCRGLQEQEGVNVIETDSPMVEANSCIVPNLSDFLFGYATPQHYVSYRNRSKGTFYIEVLTDVLNKVAKRLERLELQHILLRVNRLVSSKATGTPNRQIPKPEHTLKKQLYFL